MAGDYRPITPAETALYCCLVLPFPPSVNNLFAGRARRYQSERYKAWIEEAGWVLKRQKPPRIEGHVEMRYTYGRPDNVIRDLSNFIKPVEDLIVGHKVIADDHLVQRLSAEWAPEDDPVEGVRIEIIAV